MPRETYTVKFRDGHEQTFDGPPGMSDADLVQRARQERKFAGGDIATTFAGGATRHLLEDEPQTVNALLSGASTAAGLGPSGQVVAPFVSSGLKRLSQFLATGHADPVGGTELAQDAVEGAIGGYGGVALSKAAQLTRGARGAVVNAAERFLPAPVRGVLRGTAKVGMLNAATSEPVLGVAEAVGEGLTPEGIRRSFGRVLGGVTPGVEAEAATPGMQEMQRRLATRPSAAMRDYGEGRVAALDTARASLRPTGTGAPTAAPAPGAGYGPWLDELAEAATPPPPGELGAVTGWPASPPSTGADYPAWLQSLARDAGETTPGELAWPASRAPLDDLPTWGQATVRAPAAPPAPPAPVPTPAPPTPPTPALPSWMRANSGTAFRPAAEVSAQSGGAATAAAPVAPAPVTSAAAPARRLAPEVMPRAGTAEQYAMFTPEARAARAAAPPAAAVAPDLTEEQAGLLEQLLSSESFRPLIKLIGGS